VQAERHSCDGTFFGSVAHGEMSSKRYEFKLIEAAYAAELETRLREAESQQWSAVGVFVRRPT
jgi:hypothetical protein